jgi:hypothetical protein
MARSSPMIAPSRSPPMINQRLAKAHDGPPKGAPGPRPEGPWALANRKSWGTVTLHMKLVLAGACYARPTWGGEGAFRPLTGAPPPADFTVLYRQCPWRHISPYFASIRPQLLFRQPGEMRPLPGNKIHYRGVPREILEHKRCFYKFLLPSKPLTLLGTVLTVQIQPHRDFKPDCSRSPGSYTDH